MSWITRQGRAAGAALAAAAITAAVLAAGAGARSAVAPSNTAAPSISGTVAVGSTLSASPGSWSGDTPISYSYAWQRCNDAGASCAPIPGATASTYTLLSADASARIRVSVVASNVSGQASALSSATGEVSATQAPRNTAGPTISGTGAQGQTLTLSQGTWSGPTPITFTYQWRRCDTGGNNCVDASSVVTSNTITLAAADVGRTIRGIVYARNAGGTASAVTPPSVVIAAAATGPANTAAPAISGTATVGQTLTVSSGSWSGPGPITYTYQWKRCDSAGNACADASSVISTNTIALTSADVGRTIRGVVYAKGPNGASTAATSAPTAVVTAPSGPAGAVKLADGRTSVPASSVDLPVRLVISRVQFTPGRIAGRQPVTMRVWITDTRGYAVRDALVLVTTLPYGWTRQPAEARTATDGSVLVTLQPTVRMPLRRAALVAFVRARAEGDDLLAGVSIRRLVQVRIG